MPVNGVGAVDLSALVDEGEDKCSGRLEAMLGMFRDVANDRLIYPVVVRPLGSRDAPPYELISGWLVWSAAMHCAKEAIPAIVLRTDELGSASIAFRLNHHRLGLTRAESSTLARTVERLLEDAGLPASYRDVAQVLGCSKSWAFKLLNGSASEEELEASDEPWRPKKTRGRPTIRPVFTMTVVDPLGRESTVRLRASIGGRGDRAVLQLERAEESRDWELVSVADFVRAVMGEVERLTRLLNEDSDEPVDLEDRKRVRLVTDRRKSQSFRIASGL